MLNNNVRIIGLEFSMNRKKNGVDKLITPPFKHACVVRSPLNRAQLPLDLPKMLHVTTTCATLKCLIWSFGQPNTHTSDVL